MCIKSPQQSVSPSTQFFRLNQLKKLLGVSGSSIWMWSKNGEFPKPVKLAKNTTAWRATDVEAWSLSRITTSQKKDDAE